MATIQSKMHCIFRWLVSWMNSVTLLSEVDRILSNHRVLGTATYFFKAVKAVKASLGAEQIYRGCSSPISPDHQKLKKRGAGGSTVTSSGMNWGVVPVDARYARRQAKSEEGSKSKRRATSLTVSSRSQLSCTNCFLKAADQVRRFHTKMITAPCNGTS